MSTTEIYNCCVISANTSFNCFELISFTNPSCDGVCNGTIFVSTSYGTPPFTYSASNGTTLIVNNTGNFLDLCEGTWILTVSDSLGSVEYLFQPIVLTNSFYVNINSFLGGFCVTITGGTLPYKVYLDNNPLFFNLNNTTNCYSADCSTLSIIKVQDSSR